MNILNVKPENLEPNPWNSNTLTPEAEVKLQLSIERLGMFKPIIIRELPNGTMQILGGQHRAEIAARMGLTIPAINLGLIEDQQAKEIGIIDNGRYGHDQADLLAKLLEDMGDPKELSTFLPFDLSEIDAMTAVSKIDLDSLELDEHDAEPITPIKREAKTHAILKFKVPIDDQGMILDQLNMIIDNQGLDDTDSLVRAGEALLWLTRAYQQSK